MAGRRDGRRRLRSLVGACAVVGACALAAVAAGRAASGACPPGLATSQRWLNEGPTDYATYLRPVGRLRAVALFLDFPDAPASESPRSLYDLMFPTASAWFRAASYGRLTLSVDPVERWYRIAEPSIAFHPTEESRLLAEAVAAADADVDFASYQLVYLVLSQDAAIRWGSGLSLPADSPDLVRADGVAVRHAVLLGPGTGPREQWPYAKSLVHETAHVFGLPDLNPGTPGAASSAKPVGDWDVMAGPDGRDLLAWHKAKLGWLDAPSFRCLAGPGTLRATIAPLESAGGVKAVVLPTGTSTAVVLEARRTSRNPGDGRTCVPGVLVYSVDADQPTLSGRQIVLKPAVAGSSAPRPGCGDLASAPYDVGRRAVFADDALGLTVRVVRSTKAGYVVLVTRTR